VKNLDFSTGSSSRKFLLIDMYRKDESIKPDINRDIPFLCFSIEFRKSLALTIEEPTINKMLGNEDELGISFLDFTIGSLSQSKLAASKRIGYHHLVSNQMIIPL